MQVFKTVLAAVLFAFSLPGQSYTLSTIAPTVTYPAAVAIDQHSDVFIAVGNRIVRWDSSGTVVTVAGNSAAAYTGDNGPATSATLSGPQAVAVDSAGNLYIADTVNNVIRKVSNGVITTIAGGGSSYPGDNGPATSAQLIYPAGVAVDSAGNVYVADLGHARIREISNGVITTIAGTTPGFSGDNGPAIRAQLDGPYGIALDSSGNLFIADSNNQRIREISNGIITTVTGSGPAGVNLGGFGGDNGPATSALLNEPSGVAVDSAGNLFIADTVNSVVREVSDQIITTIAGGAATSGQLSAPLGVAVDPAGKVYIADGNLNGLRLLTPASASPSIGSVTTAYGTSTIAQNDWIAIKGTNLVPANTPATGVIWSNAPSFTSGEMPTELGPIRVTVNGNAAFVYFYCSAATDAACSADQINVLTPLDSTIGPVEVIVSNNGVASAPYTVNMASISPSFLLLNAGGLIVSTHLDGSLIGPANLYPGLTTPAQPGEIIVAYGVGFGLPAAPIVNGSAAQSGSLPSTPACQVGGYPADVAAALISPGLYQFNITIPPIAPNGEVAVVCSYAGSSTLSGNTITVLR